MEIKNGFSSLTFDTYMGFKIMESDSSISIVHHPQSKLAQGTCNMSLTIHFIQFQKISVARRKKSDANKCSTFTELTDDIFFSKGIQPIRSALMIHLL